MALLTCDFCSSVLGQNTPVTVILPERRHRPRVREDKKYPVLYALHGHGQDHTNWQRDGFVEHLLKEKDVVVVLPNGVRSFYTDAKHGHEYFTYLTEELPIIIQNYFPVSGKREDTFIAGISMGGYGALKAGLWRPDLYAGVAALSGGFDPFGNMKNRPEGMFSCRDLEQNLCNIFGGAEEFYRSDNNLINAFDKAAASGGAIPKIYMCCGVDDFVYQSNLDMRDHIQKRGGAELVFEDGPGDHNWDFWNRMMPNVLGNLGLLQQRNATASSLG